ncbi:serine/threonine-protein kinase RIO3-like protein, partial [Euroglyphus maynei]
MSEQLALDLNAHQSDCPDESFDQFESDDGRNASNNIAKEFDCSNDEMLAKLLQHELDLEHDRMLKLEEKQYNANSKVQLSFGKLRRTRDEDLGDSDLDDEIHHEYGEESKHWDFFEQKEKQAPKIGKLGYVMAKNGEVTTKHDIELNKCRNACKVMEFESDIRTGDGGGFPMKLSNNVYNALKVHSISEGKRMARLHEKKEKSSAEKAVDAKSRILLFKLINAGTLETMNGIIATGKESVVIHGIGQNIDKGIPLGEVAVKVFKTTITEFRDRIQYIIGDPILEQTGKLSKQNPKLTIPLWAEKEMHNLNRLRKFGVACPEVVQLKKHILIMTFIGRDGRPAPQLKNLIFSEELFTRIWIEIEKLMIKLYKECDMIHADLSEYNLLWHENRLWCIDVSQAIRTTHPMAFRFLWRDCVNICK